MAGGEKFHKFPLLHAVITMETPVQAEQMPRRWSWPHLSHVNEMRLQQDMRGTLGPLNEGSKRG
jgi:hypothetical protein